LKAVRRRYLALEIDAPESFGPKELMDAIWGSVLKLYGEYGASRTGLVLIDCNAEKGFAVIRTVHTAVEMVRTALASLTSIANKPAAVHVLRVSGTIKALYEKSKR
jgi:RNase P/RNase MRP subunit POP5